MNLLSFNDCYIVGVDVLMDVFVCECVCGKMLGLC